MTTEEAIERCEALATGALLADTVEADAIRVVLARVAELEHERDALIERAVEMSRIFREQEQRIAVLEWVATAADAVDRTRHRNHTSDEATCPIYTPQRELAAALAAYRAGLAPAPATEDR
jgi:hypothetical protein